MAHMHSRFAAVAVVITLLGPSLGAAVCAWTCADDHHTPAAADPCHERGEQDERAFLASGQECHDVGDTPFLVRPVSTAEWSLAVAALRTTFDVTAGGRTRAVPPRRLTPAPPGPSRVLPPLRI